MMNLGDSIILKYGLPNAIPVVKYAMVDLKNNVMVINKLLQVGWVTQLAQKVGLSPVVKMLFPLVLEFKSLEVIITLEKALKSKKHSLI